MNRTENPTQLAARIGIKPLRHGLTLTLDDLLDLAVSAYWRKRAGRDAA